MTINIERQDKFGRWNHYQSKIKQTDAINTMLSQTPKMMTARIINT